MNPDLASRARVRDCGPFIRPLIVRVGLLVGALVMTLDAPPAAAQGNGDPKADLSNLEGGLRALWGSSARDVWAVGSDGAVVHFDGRAWKIVEGVPMGDSVRLEGSFNAVWGSGPSDIWAVGAKGALARGSGLSWSRETSVTAQDLAGIWGSGAKDVWAVGKGGTILRYNGTAWATVRSGTTRDLVAIWGSGPSDIWVAQEDTSQLLHCAGADWSAPKGAIVMSPATGIWGSGPKDIWFVSGDRGVYRMASARSSEE